MPSVRDIIRSTLTRFLPGWIGALIAFPLIFAPHSFLELGRIQFALLTIYTAATLSGHVLVLGALRRRLRPDANITGRKSVVVGACSVGALLITSFLARGGRGYAEVTLVYAGVAAMITTAVYAPWIRSAVGDTAQQPVGHGQ